MLSDLDPRKSSIEKRIYRRLELLKEWERNGIPAGLRIPASLVEAREWNLPSLGIQPIGSPSDFTTTHLRHGKSVQKIWDILKRLRAKYEHPQNRRVHAKSNGPPSAEKMEQLATKLAEAKEQLVHVVSQWNVARDEIKRQRNSLDSAERQIADKDQKLAATTKELTELRRQLKSGHGLRLIE